MAKNIEAGRAVLKLSIDDTALKAGFDKLQRRVQQTAKKIRGAGLAIGALGTAIVAPLGLAVKKFLDLGDQLNKMSARTGIAVEALSELKFAAEQSGTSIETVEKAVATMQKQLLAASQGMSTAVDALAELNLTFQDLENLSPEDQLTTIVDRLATITDPSKRAAVAMAVLGKSGQKLLPLVGQMGELREEAQALGITMDEQTAQGAADLADAFNRVVSLVTALAVKVGAALAPALEEVAFWLAEVVGWAVKFVDENQTMVIIVGVIGAGLVTLGGTLIVLGSAMSIAAIASGGLATALAFLSANPIVLIIAGIVALGLAIAALLDWMGLLGDESEETGDKMEEVGDKNRKAAEETAAAIAKSQKEGLERAAKAQADFEASRPKIAAAVTAAPAAVAASSGTKTDKDQLEELKFIGDVLNDTLRFIQRNGGLLIGAK